MKKLKALYLDIENSRMIVEFPTYSLKDNNYIHPRYIKKDWYVTCVAWAELDLQKQKIGKIETVAVNDFKSYKKDFSDDEGVIRKVHNVLQDVDLIIGHNSDSFDIKKLNYKFIKYGLDPIDFPATVDTLKAARKYAKASSNSLFYLAKEFGVEMKIQLAPGTMHAADAGCEKSLKKLVKYNKGDIKSGAELYFKLMPYIKNHPNIAKIMGEKVDLDAPTCQNCGSSNVFKNGTRTTKTAKYHRYACKDCGSYTKGRNINQPTKAQRKAIKQAKDKAFRDAKITRGRSICKKKRKK